MRFADELSDDATLTELGRRLARWRLDRNLTQQQLADEAGLSRATVARMELGQSVTMTGLVRMLRALHLLENLDALVPQPLPSPIDQLERENVRRQRAAGAHGVSDNQEAAPWQWRTS